MTEKSATHNTTDATPGNRILQVLVDSVSSMIGYWDASQHNVFANRAYEDWFGIAPGRMGGMHIRDLLGEALYRANLPYIEGVLRGEPQEFERTIPTPDGKGVCHSLAQYIPDVVDGNVRGFSVLVSDISAVKRADEELRISEARFRDLFERVPQPYQSLGDDGRIRAVNLAWTQLFGYGHDEVLGHHIGEFLAESSRHKLAIEFPKFKAKGTVAGVTMDIVCKDGRQRTVAVTGNTSCDTDGRCVCTHCLLTDVTEQIGALEELRASNERFRLLYEYSPLGIGMVSPNDRLIRNANPAFCHLLGYTAEEMALKSHIDITHPDDQAVTRQSYNDLISGACSHYEIEKRYLHKEGHIVWASLVGTAVRDADGKMLYGLGIIKDITENKKAEQIRIEHLEQQRDVLVREVHHRIKNNLQGVIGLIEQIKRKQPAAADALEEAASQISTIAVVHGLHSTTLSSEVRPRQLVRAIVDSLERLSAATIFCREDDEHPEWEWRLNARDVVSIALIINELLYNAIKHTQPGGAIEVAFSGHGIAFGVRVRNQPAALSPDFDFAAGSGLGTGLTLITSLLPLRGASLDIRQQGDAVEAHLELTHPCAKAVVIGNDHKEETA